MGAAGGDAEVDAGAVRGRSGYLLVQEKRDRLIL